MSGLPSISMDGRFVSFISYAPNLVDGDTNGMPDVFLRDLTAQATSRASLASGDTQSLGAVQFVGSIVTGDSVTTSE